MAKERLVWHTERRRVNDLVPYERNPRKISEEQIEALKRSLKKFNLVELPAVDTDSTVIAGHQRLKVLQLLGRGDEMIECRLPNRKLTKSEFEAYLLTSNAVRADWNYDLLRSFDTDMLLTIGFKEDELTPLFDGLLETEIDDFNVEKELAKIKKPKTKLGDLYQLGSHRLICGDATDLAVLKHLVGTEEASMVYSDPVYNIGIDYDKGIGGKKSYGGEVNDTRTDSEYKAFLRVSIENALAVSTPDTHVFYWNDESQIGLVQNIFAELGLTNRRVCLWVKNGSYPTPGIAFSKAYEPCMYATRGKPYLTKGIDNLNEIMNREIGTGNRLIDDILDLLNIWLVKRLAGQDYQHATAKPPTLHEKAMRRCTRPGDIILDSFGGSGSTLIAAEQLKRRAYVVELEPVFCDLIILRYEKLTGNKAKKLN